MNNNNKILSDITVHMKYAKYIPELNRRETWEELVTRNKEMHQKRYPDLYNEIEDLRTQRKLLRDELVKKQTKPTPRKYRKKKINV